MTKKPDIVKNPAAKAVRQPDYRPKRVQPRKGKGSYRRQDKAPSPQGSFS